MLNAACAQLAEWREHPNGAGLIVSVNISHRQLADPEFGLILKDALEQTGLDPRALRLEVKENALSREPEAVHRALQHALDRARACARTSTTSGPARHRSGCCTASRATR